MGRPSCDASSPSTSLTQRWHSAKDPSAQENIRATLSKIFNDLKAGAMIQRDLKKDLSRLPAWMHPLLKDLNDLTH